MTHAPDSICADCSKRYDAHREGVNPEPMRIVPRYDCSGLKSGFRVRTTSGQVAVPTIPAPPDDELEDTRPGTPEARKKTPQPFPAQTDFPNWRRLFDAFCALDSHRQHALGGIAETLKGMKPSDVALILDLVRRLAG